MVFNSQHHPRTLSDNASFQPVQAVAPPKLAHAKHFFLHLLDNRPEDNQLEFEPIRGSRFVMM
jgi:hypothetical protein